VSFHRKNIRLTPRDYIGKRIYFITICCEKRRPIFANEPLGHWLATRLLGAAIREDFAIHAYCIMPDHLHPLLEGLHENCDLVRFISSFKQETEFIYQKRFGRQLWQSKYYDHVLRKAEATDAVAWYIWLNPVRKGLCAAPQHYPLSGSLTMTNWKERCAPAHLWFPPWKPAKKLLD
jgi:REP-associated tyrosine transposase